MKPELRHALDRLAWALRRWGYVVVSADHRGEDIAWVSRDGCLHVACARWYCQQIGAVRFTIDRRTARVDDRARRLLGLPAVTPTFLTGPNSYHHPGIECAAEQTCLFDEVDKVAWWLAKWIATRDVARSGNAPEPPVEWEGEPAWVYGWSARAADKVEEHCRAQCVARAKRRLQGAA